MVQSTRSRSRSSSTHLAGWLAALAALAFPARANADVEPIALRYEASATCPGEGEFVAWVEAHTRRWTRVAVEGVAIRDVRVRVAADTSGASGSLTVRAVDGAVTERVIRGPTCAEVSEALAVMVAVAIDPRAESGAVVGNEPPRPTNQAEGEKDETGDTRATPPPAVVPADPSRPERPRAPEFASPSSKPMTRPRFSLDIRAETTSAVLRGSLPGIGASLTVDLSVPPARRGIHVAGPSLAAGMRQSFPMERPLRGGSADLSWTAGHLRLCPLRVLLDRSTEASACAESNVGVLRASARGFAESKGASTFWLDVGASVGTTVSLSKSVFLSSTFLVSKPLVRQPFTLASGAPVASVPPLGVLGGLGVGLRI